MDSRWPRLNSQGAALEGPNFTVLIFERINFKINKKFTIPNSTPGLLSAYVFSNHIKCFGTDGNGILN